MHQCTSFLVRDKKLKALPRSPIFWCHCLFCPAYSYDFKSFRCIFYRERSAALVACEVRSSRIRCEHQKPWPFAASANEQLQVISQILPRVIAQHTTPSCSGSSPTWHRCQAVPVWELVFISTLKFTHFHAAQRTASIILKLMALVFQKETVTLGLFSSGSLLFLPELWANVFRETEGFT